MNVVFVSGNLVKDPEVRVVGTNLKVATVGVAVKDRGKKNTVSFFDIDFWNQSAELIGQHYVKGQQISVRGVLKQESYNNKEGVKINKVKIISDEILNLPARKPEPVTKDEGQYEYQPEEANISF